MTPSRFREELKRFDKQLDFEWNGKKQEWQIVGTDLKKNRYIIKRFPLGTIHTIGLPVLQELYECSPIKQGGAKALNRRIDELIEAEEKVEEQQMQDKINERLEDAWMHFQYKEGLRVSMTTAHKDGGTEEIVITDKRRFHDTP